MQYTGFASNNKSETQHRLNWEKVRSIDVAGLKQRVSQSLSIPSPHHTQSPLSQASPTVISDTVVQSTNVSSSKGGLIDFNNNNKTENRNTSANQTVNPGTNASSYMSIPISAEDERTLMLHARELLHSSISSNDLSQNNDPIPTQPELNLFRASQLALQYLLHSHDNLLAPKIVRLESIISASIAHLGGLHERFEDIQERRRSMAAELRLVEEEILRCDMALKQGHSGVSVFKSSLNRDNDHVDSNYQEDEEDEDDNDSDDINGKKYNSENLRNNNKHHTVQNGNNNYSSESLKQFEENQLYSKQKEYPGPSPSYKSRGMITSPSSKNSSSPFFGPGSSKMNSGNSKGLKSISENVALDEYQSNEGAKVSGGRKQKKILDDFQEDQQFGKDYSRNRKVLVDGSHHFFPIPETPINAAHSRKHDEDDFLFAAKPSPSSSKKDPESAGRDRSALRSSKRSVLRRMEDFSSMRSIPESSDDDEDDSFPPSRNLSREASTAALEISSQPYQTGSAATSLSPTVGRKSSLSSMTSTASMMSHVSRGGGGILFSEDNPLSASTRFVNTSSAFSAVAPQQSMLERMDDDDMLIGAVSSTYLASNTKNQNSDSPSLFSQILKKS